MKSHIDLVGCVMSAERTSIHQKTLTKKALKHISEVLGVVPVIKVAKTIYILGF